MKDRWTARWFRKRALLYHLLVAILAPGCLYAGWWQIHRAADGNTLSYLYAIEWPIFAILSLVGWWQLIHEDPAAVESRKVERARRAANRGPFVPPAPDAASGFSHPLGSAAHGALGPGGADGSDGELAGVVPWGQGGVIAPGTGLSHPESSEDQPAVHALSSYNAYLARLSAGGGRKSWRNPHGLATGRTHAPPPSAGAGPGDHPASLEASPPAEIGPVRGPAPRVEPSRGHAG